MQSNNNNNSESIAKFNHALDMIVSIYDLEWSIHKKKRQIIQIGYIIYNTSANKIIKKGNLYVKPYFNSYVNKRIEKLTGITNKVISKKGVSLQKGIRIFFRDIQKCEIIISNGKDYNILKENCTFSGISVNLNKFNFFNCRYFLAKKANKKYLIVNSCDLNKFFNFKKKKNILPHNAIDDCYLILQSLRYNNFF